MAGIIADIIFDSDDEDVSITYDEMERFLTIAWGNLGKEVAQTWKDFNKRFFRNQLSPVPIVIVSTSPYGKWTAQTVESLRRIRRIEIVMPDYCSVDPATKGTLLHEMLHQYLFERGEDSGHNTQAWCREIMRLSKQLGSPVWAAPETKNTLSAENEKRVGKLSQRRCPKTGATSLSVEQLALWPSSIGLEFDRFDNHIMMQDIEDDAALDRLVHARATAKVKT